MLQTIIVILILAATLGLVLRALVRAIKGKNRCNGCCNCHDCPARCNYTINGDK